MGLEKKLGRGSRGSREGTSSGHEKGEVDQRNETAEAEEIKAFFFCKQTGPDSLAEAPAIDEVFGSQEEQMWEPHNATPRHRSAFFRRTKRHREPVSQHLVP